MFENHKKLLKYVGICIFVLFTLNKCTTSCTRGTKIKQLETTCAENKSCIDSLNACIEQKNTEINLLNVRLDGMSNLNTAVSAERQKIDEVNQKLNDKNTNALDILKKKLHERDLTIKKLQSRLKEIENNK